MLPNEAQRVAAALGRPIERGRSAESEGGEGVESCAIQVSIRSLMLPSCTSSPSSSFIFLLSSFSLFPSDPLKTPPRPRARLALPLEHARQIARVEGGVQVEADCLEAAHNPRALHVLPVFLVAFVENFRLKRQIDQREAVQGHTKKVGFEARTFCLSRSPSSKS